MQYLVVAGDYKTYNHIQTVKHTKQLQWVIPFPGLDQYLELLRAIANANGCPTNQKKRNARQFLHERYEIMSPHFPINWFPDVILEGMFMIQSTPFLGCTMKQYSEFLLDQYVQYYIQKNVADIHIMFDHANRHQHHPRLKEHAEMQHAFTITPSFMMPLKPQANGEIILIVQYAKGE